MISVREFARRVGVAENAVRDAIKRGRIVTNAEGRIDPETETDKWYENRDPAKVRPGAGTSALAKRPEPSRTGKIRGPKPKLVSPAAAAQSDASSQGEGFADLKTKKVSLEIELLKEELNQVRKDTIPLEEVKRAVAAFARVHRDGVLNFSSRYAGLIAGELGVEPAAVAGTLDKHLRIHLEETANEPNPFADAE